MSGKTTYTPVQLEGLIKLKIAPQSARSRWEQKMFEKVLGDGTDIDPSLIWGCHIAKDVNDSFPELQKAIGYGLLANPHSPARFYTEKRSGLRTLTWGALDPVSGDRYKITFRGEAVPKKLRDIAMAHDRGKPTRAATVALDLSKAEVSLVKYERSPDPRTRHDVDAKTGETKPRKSKTFNRCWETEAAVS